MHRPSCHFVRLILAALLLSVGLAPSPALAQTGGITGFVRDTTGGAISGALVRATTGPSAGSQAVTGIDGSYTLSGLNAGQYGFAASKDGFTQASRTFTVVSGTTSRIDFSLRADSPTGGAIQGQVLRQGTNDPIPGATVRVTSGVTVQSTTTGTNGAYRIAGLPEGSYRLEASRVGFTSQARSGVTVRVGSTTTVTISLRVRGSELATLQGRVTNDRGQLLSGVRVELFNGASTGRFATTDRRGFYRIQEIIPDTYDVQYFKSGFSTIVLRSLALGAAQRVTRDVQLTNLGPATATIEGVVDDSFGQPLAGARVQITAGPVTGRSDITDNTGAYHLRNLPAGRYTLTATASGFLSSSATGDLAVGETERLDFILSVDPAVQTGSVRGVVTNAGGVGLADVQVQVTAGPTSGQTTLTDDDGDYSIEGLVPGTYAITFTASGFSQRTVSGVQVFSNQATTLNVELNTTGGGGTLTGTVTDASGIRLSGVTVSAAGRTTTTAADGSYTLTNVATGFVDVTFSKAGFRSVTVRNVHVMEGVTTQLNASLTNTADTGSLAGIVRDVSGRAVQDALVELTGPSTNTSTRTNADGRFLFSGIPAAGGYTVTVSASGMETSTQSGVVVPANSTANLTFTLRAQSGVGSIAGTVSNLSGIPITRATVTIIRGPVVNRQSITGSTGRYNLTGLPPGRYTVEAGAVGYIPQRAEIEVRASQAAAKNFFLVRRF